MTQKRKDAHSTEFGLWLREQKEIDSSLGYLATNLDFIWTNYKTGEWMLIEEKRYLTQPKKWQHQIFTMLHKACRSDILYRGIHLLVFEKTSPDDGYIVLNHKRISKEGLLDFLQFKTAA